MALSDTVRGATAPERLVALARPGRDGQAQLPLRPWWLG